MPKYDFSSLKKDKKKQKKDRDQSAKLLSEGNPTEDIRRDLRICFTCSSCEAFKSHVEENIVKAVMGYCMVRIPPKDRKAFRNLSELEEMVHEGKVFRTMRYLTCDLFILKGKLGVIRDAQSHTGKVFNVDGTVHDGIGGDYEYDTDDWDDSWMDDDLDDI